VIDPPQAGASKPKPASHASTGTTSACSPRVRAADSRRSICRRCSRGRRSCRARSIRWPTRPRTAAAFAATTDGDVPVGDRRIDRPAAGPPCFL